MKTYINSSYPSKIRFWKKFHGQASDHVWSFRSSPLNTSRQKEGLKKENKMHRSDLKKSAQIRRRFLSLSQMNFQINSFVSNCCYCYAQFWWNCIAISRTSQKMKNTMEICRVCCKYCGNSLKFPKPFIIRFVFSIHSLVGGRKQVSPAAVVRVIWEEEYPWDLSPGLPNSAKNFLGVMCDPWSRGCFAAGCVFRSAAAKSESK